MYVSEKVINDIMRMANILSTVKVIDKKSNQSSTTDNIQNTHKFQQFDEKLIQWANTKTYQDAIDKSRIYFDSSYGFSYEQYLKAVNTVLEMLKYTSDFRYIPSEEQLRVLYSCSNRLLIESGAGTGKTTTIIVKMFLEQNIFKLLDREILAITYTKAGSEDMDRKYKKITELFNGNKQMSFSTIHKYCKDLYQLFYPSTVIITETQGIFQNYYDEELCEEISEEVTLYSIIKEGYDTLDLKFALPPSNIYSALTSISEKCIKTEEEFRDMESYMDYPLSLKQLMCIKDYYQRKKSELDAVDYIDMLEKAYEILLDISNQGIDNYKFDNDVQKYKVLFKSIYVDEFQDISPLQMEIVRLLLKINPKARFTCIGDADQSIYSFRGANVHFMLNFPVEFKDGLDIIFLTRNRRSVKNIIDLSSFFINYNKNRFPKVIRGLDDNIVVKNTDNIKIVNDIGNLISDGTIKNVIKTQWETDKNHFNDIAILYREHKQSISLLTYMICNRYPFYTTIEANSSNYVVNMKELYDLLQIMKFIKYPNIPELIQNYLWKIVPGMSKSDAFTISTDIRVNPDKKLLSYLNQNINWRSSIKSIINLRKLLMDNKTTSEEFFTALIYQYSIAYYNKILSLSKVKRDNVLNYIIEYMKYRPNLKDIDNIIKADKTWLMINSKNKLGVGFNTFHTSKGLEFKRVFILPISNSITPKEFQYSNMSEFGRMEYLEEERRLMYVAITRAINELTIFYSGVSLFASELLQCKKFIEEKYNITNVLEV